MNEEVMIILKMVEDGKISADKAKDLIDALENTSKTLKLSHLKDMRINF